MKGFFCHFYAIGDRKNLPFSHFPPVKSQNSLHEKVNFIVHSHFPPPQLNVEACVRHSVPGNSIARAPTLSWGRGCNEGPRKLTFSCKNFKAKHLYMRVPWKVYSVAYCRVPPSPF